MSAKLNVGDRAPDFTASLMDGSSLALSSLRGRVVHLAFHRYASCPICNYSLRQFEQRHTELVQRGIVYIPIFHSPAGKMREFYPAPPPFPVIVDPQRVIYRRYGLTPAFGTMLHPQTLKDMGKLVASLRAGFRFRLAADGPLTTSPGDFLIDPDGVIKALHYGHSIGDSWIPDEAIKCAGGILN